MKKNSIKVSTLLGIFFVEEYRKNKNRFDLKDKDKYYFIDSYENNNLNIEINHTKEKYIFFKNKKKFKWCKYNRIFNIWYSIFCIFNYYYFHNH